MAKQNEVDMSPAAVRRRLETVQSLYALMVHLRSAKIVGPVEPKREPDVSGKKPE